MPPLALFLSVSAIMRTIVFSSDFSVLCSPFLTTSGEGTDSEMSSLLPTQPQDVLKGLCLPNGIPVRRPLVRPPVSPRANPMFSL